MGTNFMISPTSWISLLTTARAPISILLIAGAGLLIPPQTQDMLAALDGTIAGKSFTFWFQLSLAILSLSAWYWARALLNARFDVGDNKASREALRKADDRLKPVTFAALPRLLFALSVGIGFVMIWQSPRPSIQFAYLALWSIPAGLFLVFRLNLFPGKADDAHPRTSASRSGHAWIDRPLAQFTRLIQHAPYGPSIPGALIGISMVAFVWGTLESFIVMPKGYEGLPAMVAAAFPGPTAALFILALIIAPLSALTFVFDGLPVNITIFKQPIGIARLPVILLLLLWITVWSLTLNLHAIRIEPQMDVGERQELSKLFAEWVQACAPPQAERDPIQPVIVAISGGASRAAIWGARILYELEQLSGPGKPRIFAVSSVSGGSLGAGAYMSLLAALAKENKNICAEDVLPVRRERMNALKSDALAQDALGPLLAGALIVDVPRAIFAPVAMSVAKVTGWQPRGGDRAEALERAFEHLWKKPRDGPNRVGFAEPFLSLFYEPSKDNSSGKTVWNLRPSMPIWIANGTHLTGVPALTVPFILRTPEAPVPDWPFLAAVDVLTLLRADVPISTAINNTARFPYLEPSGELLGTAPNQDSGALIDGGYFENEGLQTALELADWLGRQKIGTHPVNPIIIQATSDGAADIDQRDIVRCGGDHDDPSKVPPARQALQLVAPLVGLYNVRGGHSAVALREAQNRYCFPQSFFHFYLAARPAGPDIPLNWILSTETANFIRDDAMTKVCGSGNAEELEKLSRIFSGP